MATGQSGRAVMAGIPRGEMWICRIIPEESIAPPTGCGDYGRGERF
jgi:hypothetical protein